MADTNPITPTDDTALNYLTKIAASYYDSKNQHQVLIGRATPIKPFFAGIIGVPSQGGKQAFLLEPQQGSTRASALLKLIRSLEVKVYEHMTVDTDGDVSYHNNLLDSSAGADSLTYLDHTDDARDPEKQAAALTYSLKVKPGVHRYTFPQALKQTKMSSYDTLTAADNEALSYLSSPFQACVLGLQPGWKDVGFLIVPQNGSTRAKAILKVIQKMEHISDGVISNLRERC